MKKSSITLVVFILSTIFISCTKNETSEEVCTKENYLVNFDKYVKKIVRTPTDLTVVGKTTDFTYNKFNLLERKYSFNIDTQNEYNFSYGCNNNVNSMYSKTLTYNSDNKLITSYSESSPEDSYDLTHNSNIVTITGKTNTSTYNNITLELGTNNLVNKITRLTSYSTFEYDANNNITKASDFDLNNTLINEYELTYDQKNNAFYGQLSSVYLDRIVLYFAKSVKDGVENLSFNTLVDSSFPYFKNNLVKVIKKENNVDKEILKREFTYDSNNYPTKFEFTTVGYHDSTVTITYQ